MPAQPGEVRVQRDPSRDLSGKHLRAQVRVFTTAQWVAQRTAEAEDLLWRKTCKQCHALTTSPGRSLPQVAAANRRTKWMPHAKFDHAAHRGFTCVSCPAKALTSTEASDIPPAAIPTCKPCQA